MKFRSSGLSILLIGIGLSSCVTTNAEGVRQVELQRVAVSGERTKVGFAGSVNPDCSVRTLPKSSVLEPPKHGKIEIVHEDVFPNAKGDYTKCNRTRVLGTVAYYTAAKGFIGKDRIVVRTSFSDGKVSDAVMNITVAK